MTHLLISSRPRSEEEEDFLPFPPRSTPWPPLKGVREAQDTGPVAMAKLREEKKAVLPEGSYKKFPE